MKRRQDTWQRHVANFRKANAHVPNDQVYRLASLTYRRRSMVGKGTRGSLIDLEDTSKLGKCHNNKTAYTRTDEDDCPFLIGRSSVKLSLPSGGHIEVPHILLSKGSDTVQLVPDRVAGAGAFGGVIVFKDDADGEYTVKYTQQLDRAEWNRALDTHDLDCGQIKGWPIGQVTLNFLNGGGQKLMNLTLLTYMDEDLKERASHSVDACVEYTEVVRIQVQCLLDAGFYYTDLKPANVLRYNADKLRPIRLGDLGGIGSAADKETEKREAEKYNKSINFGYDNMVTTYRCPPPAIYLPELRNSRAFTAWRKSNVKLEIRFERADMASCLAFQVGMFFAKLMANVDDNNTKREREKLRDVIEVYKRNTERIQGARYLNEAGIQNGWYAASSNLRKIQTLLKKIMGSANTPCATQKNLLALLNMFGERGDIRTKLVTLPPFYRPTALIAKNQTRTDDEPTQ